VLCESPTKIAAALAEIAFVISNIASVSPHATGTFRGAQEHTLLLILAF
jgi:hypothetical protein